ncbi:hypothetical protein KUTeg_007401 [Tegillarca granosa]|uniref:Uncharacterized protein n=1 Tax=Tegillarca granosa TaxID=220873 RepID=A0ABQ9FGG5_TEGGR|nr:hypothetical protein KUTeg_007401 [Tegillarca granosa]
MARKDVDAITIDRVHKMASDSKRAMGRNIIAKISSTKDRELIKRNTKALAGTNHAVFQQYPPEIVRQRKELLPTMKKARKDGKKAYISYNKLYIEGRLYTGETGKFGASE